MDKEAMKKIALWTAILILPGGTLVAAYRLGREHRKLVKVLKRFLKKEEKHD